MASKKRIGVLGASGYTGAELVRLLLTHPRVEIALLTADRRANQEMGEVFPQFSPYALPRLAAIQNVDWVAAKLDLVFCALPHATTQQVVKVILGQVPAAKIVSQRSARGEAATARVSGRDAAGEGARSPRRSAPGRRRRGSATRRAARSHGI